LVKFSGINAGPLKQLKLLNEFFGLHPVIQTGPVPQVQNCEQQGYSLGQFLVGEQDIGDGGS